MICAILTPESERSNAYENQNHVGPAAGVLLAAGLLLVVFFFLFLPFYGQDTVRYAPEFAWAYWPCLIWAWAFAVPIFWAMVPAWRVCGSIAVKGMAFTGKNARDLRTVSRLAFADAVIFPAGMLIVAYLGAGSAPLTLLITPLVTFSAWQQASCSMSCPGWWPTPPPCGRTTT